MGTQPVPHVTPNPDALVLGDSVKHFQSSLFHTEVVNVGSFSRKTQWTFYCYYPSAEEGEQMVCASANML